nr:hypothetical protein [Tanacetum cinerariifolium]
MGFKGIAKVNLEVCEVKGCEFVLSVCKGRPILQERNVQFNLQIQEMSDHKAKEKVVFIASKARKPRTDICQLKWQYGQHIAKQQDVIPRGLAWSNFNRFQKTDYNLLFGQVVDYVNGVQDDCTLVEQTKKPSCSTPVQVDAIINQVDLLCKQLIDVRPEMEGMVDQLKSKVIDTLTTTLETARKHAEVVEAEVVNCEKNLVECPPKANKCVAPAQDTNDTDDGYMDFENDPSQYCLDNMTISIEEDTKNGELIVSLYKEPQKETAKCSKHTEKMGLRGKINKAYKNSGFDTFLKDGNMNLDKLIADVTKSENKYMIKASEVNVVKGDGKPVLGKLFENIRRIKKSGLFKQLSYMQQRPTTPQV